LDHHSSWYHLLPWYHGLLDYLQNNFSSTVLFRSGLFPKERVFETVHHVFAALLVVFILIIMSLFAKARLKNLEEAIVPSPRITITNILEVLITVIISLMKDIIGKDYKRYVPMVGTLALFILVSNLLGLIPGFFSPTDNLNTTIGCGLVVFVYFNFHGLRVHGIHHITHLANPLGVWWGWFLFPLLFPVELIGLMVRPLSLGIRLAGNMIGDHKVLFAFAGVMPFLLPLPFYLLGLLVCIIQTIVFCLLTCVYISLHTQEEGH
jgi:F-type H+-transporting ATPase subunit a